MLFADRTRSGDVSSVNCERMTLSKDQIICEKEMAALYGPIYGGNLFDTQFAS